MSPFVRFRRAFAYANRPSKYDWSQADWEHETNLEIAAKLGVGNSAAAGVHVARFRKKLAAHTVGRLTGGAARRRFRATESHGRGGAR